MKVFLTLICGILVTSARQNNVCSNIRDYQYRASENCWYNSDAVLSVPDIIVKYNYPLEIYKVITQDGYILQLFRIPHGKNSKKNENVSLQPVLLQHGILASAAAYTINGNESMGFVLADEGYDVWLANSRGSTYGRGHTKLSLNNPRYWNFSFHEMGIYDTPKILDIIYKVTGRKDIIMIGQSMGVNIQLAYASQLPDHAKRRVKFMVYLAPTAFLEHMRSPTLLKIVPFWPVIETYSRKFGLGEIPQGNSLPVDQICFRSEIQFLTCLYLVFSLAGNDLDNFQPELGPVIVKHYPAGSSIKTMVHLLQGVSGAKFAFYDYGSILNLKYYQSTTPPNYNLSRISIPGHIMYGLNDYVSSEEGAIQLHNELPKNNTLYQITDKRYNHIDFFFAKNVYEEVLSKMLDAMKPYKMNLTQ